MEIISHPLHSKCDKSNDFKVNYTANTVPNFNSKIFESNPNKVETILLGFETYNKLGKQGILYCISVLIKLIDFCGEFVLTGENFQSNETVIDKLSHLGEPRPLPLSLINETSV